MTVAVLITFWLVALVVASEATSCDNLPCVHGLCSEEGPSYRCYCEDGYTGYECQTDFDDCRSEPCQSGGTCIDRVAGFSCLCTPGYTGRACETDVDECVSQPCLNGGSCVDDVGGFTCLCLPGYTGSVCEEDMSVCNGTASQHGPRCSNGGTCVDGPGDSFFCSCTHEYTGTLCDEDVDECASRPCQHRGLCSNFPGGFSCVCQLGWMGRRCSEKLTPCSVNDCANGGVCFLVEGSPQCFCVPDFHGPLCEWKYDECLLPDNPCLNGGTCIDGVDSYTCSCSANFIGDVCDVPCDAQSCLSSSLRETTPSLRTISRAFSSESVPYDASSSFLPSPIASVESSFQLPRTIQPSNEDSLSSWLQSTHLSIVSTAEHGTSLSSSTFGTADWLIATSTAVPGDSSASNSLFTSHHFSTASTWVTLVPISSASLDYTPTQSENLDSRSITRTSTEIALSSTSFGVAPSLPTGNGTAISSNATETNEEPCTRMTCLNGGTPFLSNGFTCSCRCPLHYVGSRCEVDMPEFRGTSYLAYTLDPLQRSLQLELTFASDASTGLLAYASSGSAFFSLYLEEGLVKFAFSCGLQKMVETGAAVTIGYLHTLHMRLTWLPTGRCVATLRVNDTSPLLGELPTQNLVFTWDKLYLGGLPPGFLPAIPVASFVGCVKNLRINGAQGTMQRDAAGGASVTPCSRWLCDITCQNDGVCISENNHRWRCQCDGGFAGPQCEHRKCKPNLCQNVPQGTSFTGPMSRVGYALPLDPTESVEIKIRFSTAHPRRASILLFLGQQSLEDPMQDFMMVTLAGGRVFLHFNLGSGTTILRSAEVINGSAHTVYAGHHKRYGWLAVDSQAKAIGLSRGSLTGLNVVPLLYVGGGMTTLYPGFVGCVQDVAVRQLPQGSYQGLQEVTEARNVARRCGDLSSPCFDNITCSHHMFSCVCVEPMTMPSCTDNKGCGAKESWNVSCDCSTCNRSEETLHFLDDSFLAFPPMKFSRRTRVHLQVWPHRPDGVLFHVGQHGDFATLRLSDGYAQFRFNLGTGSGTATLLTSSTRVQPGKWSSIQADLNGRQATLLVDDVNRATALSPGGMVSLDTLSPVYIGGVPGSGIPSLRGCVRSIEVNHKAMLFRGAVQQFNVAEDCKACDGKNS
ncbi:protein eyes shut-like [Ornithodoros turicata]|uniref:protein eyes shut-like n=1 Tax=Ornithodoros turicata TaxID=34597 RepID=UPI00313A3F63